MTRNQHIQSVIDSLPNRRARMARHREFTIMPLVCYAMSAGVWLVLIVLCNYFSGR